MIRGTVNGYLTIRNVFYNLNINQLRKGSSIIAVEVASLKPLKQFLPEVTTTRSLSKMAATTSGASFTNRLALEKSPYLLQHAHNPVDWYPWCEEAFKKAQQENKLIFLSVGYSTCHWCHVMERESFEDQDIAKIMNENFVCIKVDREERPDIDKLYMTFVQAVSGHGGWPMSVWLRPDLTPVAGGTYYPPQDQFGRPGFPSILISLSKKVTSQGQAGWPMSVWLTPNLEAVFGGSYFPPKNEHGRLGFKSILLFLANQWRDHRQKFTESGMKIMEVLREASTLDAIDVDPRAIQTPGSDCWEKCYQQLAKHFEPKFGGFSEAPKFPQPANIDFLLHYYARNPTSETGKKALSMCEYTLTMMEKGGIHDHVAQGFARYSTDDRWHVPHFEKMLYDQGQLVASYTTAYRITKNQKFADVVHDILTYVGRDLSHPLGGFYSAEDADSLPSTNAQEKKEGAFCVWTDDEIRAVLTEKIVEKDELTYADVFCRHYNVKPDGNVNPNKDPHGELKSKNVLIVTGDEKSTAENLQLSVETVKEVLQRSREILYEVRQRRPKPHLDDKMITAWNGLMMSGYAQAGQALGDTNYIQRALQCARFVRDYLYLPEKKVLLRSCYNAPGDNVTQIPVPINGFLEDYCFIIRGLLDLYEASFDPSWIEWSENLQETQDSLFWDEGGAAYFTSPAGDPSVVVRMKEDQDGSEPCGNSVAVENLLRLSAYLDRLDYKDRAAKILSAFGSRLTMVPRAIPVMASSLMFYHDGPVQVYITGKAEDPETAGLLNVVQSCFIPGRVLALVDDKENLLHNKNETVRRMKPVNNRATAYVCRNHVCSLPVTTREELSKLLASTS